ncbi:hypothetical protein ACQFN5_21985 [Klebsiella sp. WOUb02]
MQHDIPGLIKMFCQYGNRAIGIILEDRRQELIVVGVTLSLFGGDG